MDKTLEKLNTLVEKELKRAREELVSRDQAYLDLIEILRHLDSAFIKGFLGKTGTIQEAVYFESIRFAWVSLASYYLKHIDALQAQLTYSSTEEQRTWAAHLLGWTGDLERVNRFNFAAYLNLLSIEETAPNIFSLKFSHDIPDKEGYDRASYNYVQNMIERQNQGGRQRVTAKFKAIRKQMIANSGLSIIAGKFIAYQTTPDVDKYFSDLGYYHFIKQKAFEDFGADDKFGEIPYQQYLDVLKAVTGVALKHLGYCLVALERFPKVDLRDISVYTWHKDRTLEDFAAITRLPLANVKQIFACLTLDKDNVDDYTSMKGSDLPPYISIADDQLTRITYGALGGGVDFLKRELKRRYRPDYDKAVTRREARFRTDLYQYFKGERFLTAKGEIEIKLPGLHTDIDAAIYDTKTKTLGLFQLKWQDMFFTSLKERRNRISEAYNASETWLKKMQEWVAITPQTGVLKKLKFDPVHQEISKVQYFVIGRHHMHYTGLEPEPVAAWASWYQLVESYERYKINTNDPVKDLYDQLKMGLPSNRVKTEGYPEHPAYTINFKTFKFRFNHDSDESEA
ncbi:MAG: hypothetical protein JST50_02665 [Bacteroidetes bacterium]|nr:hypothetical protein [Bacteroidota bacterium]